MNIPNPSDLKIMTSYGTLQNQNAILKSSKYGWANAENDSSKRNGALRTTGSGDMDSISKNSPNNMSLSNQPGTPRDDGEMGGNFLNPFQSESYSPSMTMSV
ncbi:hypothetical protein MJG53_007820 [Ovis ammon polii x Ovis aries]|uniref:Uncharacterized protein n=1 Tax=Ovis ammon polii x Ovis aries TaxID=2918886 RepID=A0ACB9V511_9CETA|nr:hypothetical protein MJG53_007820 [Ovis ammon polii x Ovis aries]